MHNAPQFETPSACENSVGPISLFHLPVVEGYGLETKFHHINEATSYEKKLASKKIGIHNKPGNMSNIGPSR